MILGIVLLMLAVLCHIDSARRIARENHGFEVPTVYGAHSVRPSRRARRTQTLGWILSLLGAVRVGESLWILTPGWSAVTVVSLLLLVNGIPALVVTIAHNRDLGLQQ